jgi:hypothetical protein
MKSGELGLPFLHKNSLHVLKSYFSNSKKLKIHPKKTLESYGQLSNAS